MICPQNSARWIVLVPVLFLCLAAPRTVHANSQQPNIILILVDDFGRELLSSYGGTSYQTPNLDRLAREGMRFENCYATPLCVPSRAEILTGRYSFRNYMQWGELPPNEVTFAQLLKKSGYATAFAGKWHLGGWDQSPPVITRAGFDEYISFDSPKLLEDSKRGRGNRFWGGTIIQNGKSRKLDRYGPDVYSDFLVDFIRRHREQPFLSYYCMTLMHRPFHPTPKHPLAPKPGQRPPNDWLDNRGETENFAAMLDHVDLIVGKLLKTLDELNLAENTVIIFTSDNGTDNKAEASEIRSEFMGRTVRGGKYFPTELGVNVPLLIRWPSKIAAGSSTDALVDFTDLLPTLCDLGSAALPEDHPLDGTSFQPVLSNSSRERQKVLYTWGNYEHSSRKYKRPANYTTDLLHVVRDSRWKLYSDGRIFDLENDYFETKPIEPATQPKTDSARQRLQKHLHRLRTSQPRRW